jgi:N-acetylglutamate synthase
MGDTSKAKTGTGLPKSKPHELELIAGLEARLLNVWPALRTEMIKGWALRFADGYTGRANSASAITPGARMTDALLKQTVAMYRQEGLVPQVRVSPVAHPDTESILRRHGFASRGLAHTMIADIDTPLKPDARIALAAKTDFDWCVGVTSRQEAARRNPQALHAIVSRISVPARFATVVIDGEAVGFGMAAIDQGWMELGSLVIDERHRGKGLGRRLVSTLLHWGRTEDVHKAFLQVDVTNATAFGLYRGLGFQVLYDYDTVQLRQASESS